MLIPVDQALDSLLDAAKCKNKVEQLPLMSGLGKTLAEDIISNMNVPPADNSAMDGYAVRLADIQLGQAVKINQRIPAGVAPSPLNPNEAARIFTGANIPSGADTVIMQENAAESEGSVRFSSIPDRVGENIRRAGEDIAAQSKVLEKGMKLRAQELGLIASIGIESIPLFTPLKVAVISTGSELVDPGEPINLGQIYNSNRPMLMSLLQSLGYEPLDLGICGDSLTETIDALQSAAEKADVIITSGGVSVGEEDHVKAAAESLGDIDLWKVAIKPGKPFAFGNIIGVPLLGLPGNPASVFTTFLILAAPFLARLQGRSINQSSGFKIPASFSRRPVTRREYLRVRNKDGQLVPFPNQGSGVLTSACWGDGFAVQEIGESIGEGDLLEYLPFAALLNQ